VLFSPPVLGSVTLTPVPLGMGDMLLVLWAVCLMTGEVCSLGGEEKSG
jgi:hypothetical protein